MNRYHTPLRYPGGKQKLTPFIIEMMETNGLIGGEYAEPYAGGAGVAIELLLSGKVSRIHLNDVSRPVYAFWRAILEQPKEFCRKISSASMTIPEWRRQKEILSRPSEFTTLDLGFSLFFLNRCNRSGIPSGGVIGGLDQTGEWKMDARFNRNELIRRVEAIAKHKAQINIHNLDAEDFIKHQLIKCAEDTLVYCDPPYFKKADRLYLNHYTPADHERIAEVIQEHIEGRWMVSYDDAPEIRVHYPGREQFVYELNYHASRARRGSEVFFFSDDLDLPASSKIPAINRVLAGPDLFG